MGDWFSSAMARVESPEPKQLQTYKSQCDVTSEVLVSNYFKELKVTMGNNDLTGKPYLIFNVDKKGISQDHTPSHVFPVH